MFNHSTTPDWCWLFVEGSGISSGKKHPGKSISFLFVLEFQKPLCPTCWSLGHACLKSRGPQKRLWWFWFPFHTPPERVPASKKTPRKPSANQLQTRSNCSTDLSGSPDPPKSHVIMSSEPAPIIGEYPSHMILNPHPKLGVEMEHAL